MIQKVISKPLDKHFHNVKIKCFNYLCSELYMKQFVQKWPSQTRHVPFSEIFLIFPFLLLYSVSLIKLHLLSGMFLAGSLYCSIAKKMFSLKMCVLLFNLKCCNPFIFFVVGSSCQCLTFNHLQTKGMQVHNSGRVITGQTGTCIQTAYRSHYSHIT